MTWVVVSVALMIWPITLEKLLPSSRKGAFGALFQTTTKSPVEYREDTILCRN